MTLWFVLAMMTAAASFAVLWPLSRGGRVAAQGSDLAVYEDQLAEIARDRDSGLIGASEAEAARTEISRRLLAAADAEPAATVSGPSSWALLRRRLAAVAAILLLPICALSLYLALGSPRLPGEPLAARLQTPPEERTIEGMVAQIEAHLEKTPEDGRGWEVLAPVYARLGRASDAAQARRNVVRLLGENAERQADLGEALVDVANGIVTVEAKAAFDRAIALDPAEPKASYYLGLAAEQDGRTPDAVESWRALLARAAPDAPWRELVERSLHRAQGRQGGPTDADLAAATALSPDQQAEMARGMVARLAERLKSDGSNVEDWLRLMRAYMVLGERGEARAALAGARRALDGDAQKLRRVDESARALGIEG